MMSLIPSKKALDRVGDALLRLGEDPEADDLVFQQLNSYRSLFNIAMYSVNIACRRQVNKMLSPKDAKEVMVVQRIKRLDSITAKLKRFSNMHLSQMQDIGGLRVILPSIEDVEVYTKNLFARSKKIKIKSVKDYITSPKEDGYRGIHYILELENKAMHIVPFPTLLVELQVRTGVQHIWATGVEIAGIINNKNYKTGDWDADWKQFFILLSSYLAFGDTIATQSPFSPKDLSEHSEQLPTIVSLIHKLTIIEHFEAISKAVKNLSSQINQFKSTDFLLLRNDFELKESVISVYKEESVALESLTIWEKRFQSQQLKGQVVLVRAKDIKNLNKAYPNYYMDTRSLVDLLKGLSGILSKN